MLIEDIRRDIIGGRVVKNKVSRINSTSSTSTSGHSYDLTSEEVIHLLFIYMLIFFI